MKLRPYQVEAINAVKSEWESGAKSVCMVMPTGAGKTHTKTALVDQLGKRTMCIAHRQELVLQISESLALAGIYHRVIAPNVVVKFCAERHIKLLGISFVEAQAPVAVAGVQTLLRRTDQYAPFIRGVELWDIDESHHCIPDNQWGRAINLFPNAIGLGVTATPLRCDRKPLNGVFDSIVVGPSMRDLITQGYLSDYRIFCPPQSINRAEIRVSKGTGEFIRDDLITAVHGSQIVGDVVQQYLRIAPGIRGLTFCVDVETARQTADAYNAAGVPARMVNGETPDRERAEALDMLKSGELLQLCNVDLFGEGMDAPAVGVVSMARPTKSYGLFVQQFGRMMRPFEGKSHGILIDHVGNVVEHGLPDTPRVWTLDGKMRDHGPGDDIPLSVCEKCMQPRPRNQKVCPYCGHQNVPAGRSLPEQVDGDLIELDADVLAQMRGDVIDVVNGSMAIPYGADRAIMGAAARRWGELQAAQNALRDTVALWAGVWKYGAGEDDSMIHRRFYLTYGIDVVSAMALRRTDAVKLQERINNDLC